MRDDHAAHRVRVDETSVEDERNQMVMQDHRLQVQVRRDEDPSRPEGKKTQESDSRLLTTGTTRLHYVLRAVSLSAYCFVQWQVFIPRNSVKHEHNSSIDHVPFVPCQIVQHLRNESLLFHSETLDHGALPETTSTKVGR